MPGLFSKTAMVVAPCYIPPDFINNLHTKWLLKTGNIKKISTQKINLKKLKHYMMYQILLVYSFSKHRNYTGAIPMNIARLMLEKTLESSLDCKIKPVHPKGNQP